MHIPKTAGTSLKDLLLRRHKNEEERRLIYSQELNQKGFKDSPDLQVIMGHYRYGYHRFSQRPYTYHTFLRDPIEHVISHYYYSLDHPQALKNLPEEVNSLLDFVKCPYGNNLQTRFISGIEDISKNPREVLKQAKINLVRDFDVIGLVEEFDKSLLLLQKTLGWKIIYYTKRNAGKTRKKHAKPSGKELEEIRSILKYDMELYAFAKALFSAQLNKNRELHFSEKKFKFFNKWFNRLNPSYTKLKILLGLAKAS
jgi:hypothetical protein